MCALQAIDNNPQLLDPNFRRSRGAGEEDAGEQEGRREIAPAPEEGPEDVVEEPA